MKDREQKADPARNTGTQEKTQELSLLLFFFFFTSSFMSPTWVWEKFSTLRSKCVEKVLKNKEKNQIKSAVFDQETARTMFVNQE